MIFNAATGRLLCNAGRLTLLRSRVAQYSKSAAEESRAFWEKNARLNRPLSPHLTIYRFPLNANLSVGHRVTGFYLSGVVILFGLGSLYFAGDFESIFQWLKYNVHPHIMLTAKAALAFPFVYHAQAGCRHLIWDTGRWLSPAGIRNSSIGLILLSVIAAFAVASL